jgi:hypothetical protein
MKNGGWLDSIPQAQVGKKVPPKTKKVVKKTANNTEVDWDKVRSINDNTAVQAAKIFDPTGFTSWPDVYYAIDDYNKGKGSGWNIALNVLGALPVLGKLTKGAGMLAKSEKLAKTANKLSKINKTVDRVEKVVPNVAKAIGKTSDVIANASRAGKANPVAVATKVVGKVAKGVEKVDTATRKFTGKLLDKIPGTEKDVGNLVDATTSILNIGNTASDVKSVIDASNKNSKPTIDKTKTIQYYNTDPKRGEVEKPGQFADVQYVPISNSVQLQKWKEQKGKLENGGWLDSYADGGTMQEHQENYNDYKVSAPEGMVGDGFSNVGRNYSPAWGGQFQEGGIIPMAQKGGKVKKPIYVDSPNDPRYRAYQDSLSLYNFWNKDVLNKKLKKPITPKEYNNFVNKSNKLNKEKVSIAEKKLDDYISGKNAITEDKIKKQGYKKENSGIYKKENKETKGYFDPMTGVWKLYLNNKQVGMSSSKIKPIDVKFYAYEDLNGLNSAYTFDTNPLYKYPTTPVIVDKNKYNPNDPRLLDLQKRLENTLLKPQQPAIVKRPTYEPIQITPEGYAATETELKANLNITPQARIPEYFTVTDKVNQPFGGTETNYRWYPDQPLPASMSEQIYEDGTPMNTRIITPVYQDGGEVNPAMIGMMKSKIGMGNAFNHPAIKRMSQAMPKTGMTPEGIGTHYMSSVDNYAVPLLQDFGEEELTLVDPDSRSREAIRFNSPEEAQYFAEHYKEVAPMSTIFKDLNSFQTGGSIPGSVGFTYARTKGIPSEGPYAKKTMPSAQNGQEMRFYQEGLDFKPKTISREGSVIKDDLGQWAHPGEITEIDSPYITMKGVPYPVLGISDTGDVQIMYPEEEYEFDGEKVTEYPMAKNGLRQEQKGLVNLDNLLNFTNYNTKQPGGWLDTL